PLPVVLAQRICYELDVMQRNVSWMGVDGKAQISVVYDGDKPLYVKTVVISVQHDEGVCPDCLTEAVVRGVVMKCIPMELIHPKTVLLVNPSGSFVIGGPVADTGLTGRKLAVDQYGPVSHIGCVAFSGKDPTKVDRSGAYMARYIAKNLVASGLVTRCEVQLAYVIGRAEPVSVSVDAFGTSAVRNSTIAQIVRRAFDLRPAAIIEQFELRKPIYAPLSVYGHYGRLELNLPWERTDRKDALYTEVRRMLLN
ncbi:MAG: methionine adenosyltransferase domain-containing protein, partial [Clostridia bacterium]